jgi:hypothetical protein
MADEQVPTVSQKDTTAKPGRKGKGTVSSVHAPTNAAETSNVPSPKEISFSMNTSIDMANDSVGTHMDEDSSIGVFDHSEKTLRWSDQMMTDSGELHTGLDQLGQSVTPIGEEPDDTRPSEQNGDSIARRLRSQSRK